MSKSAPAPLKSVQLANIGYQLRRDLRWDPEREEFIRDDEANRLRSRRKGRRGQD